MADLSEDFDEKNADDINNSKEDKKRLSQPDSILMYDLATSQKIGQSVIRELTADFLNAAAAAEAQNPYKLSPQDPKEKAITYLQKHRILTLMENLITKVVHERPEHPLCLMIQEVEKHDWTHENTDESETNRIQNVEEISENHIHGTGTGQTSHCSVTKESENRKLHATDIAETT